MPLTIYEDNPVACRTSSLPCPLTTADTPDLFIISNISLSNSNCPHAAFCLCEFASSRFLTSVESLTAFVLCLAYVAERDVSRTVHIGVYIQFHSFLWLASLL